MRILVTGGAGYIGSHVCKALKARGYDVVVFDNLIYGHRDFVKWGDIEEGDLKDRHAIDLVLKRHQPSAVIHFAAYAYVGESVEDPSKYYCNNVTGSLNLLDAARLYGVKHIVFSSTCATYGIPQAVPIQEEHPQKPINPYGKTKLMIEEILMDYDAAYGMKSASLRYFNAAGADPCAEIGEDHDPEPHLIPLVLDAAAGLRHAITVFGTDYDTPDGTCIRDYIHVTDLADAHIKALEYVLAGGETAAFNLGTGSGYSVKEIIEVARNITERDIVVIEGQRRLGDPPCLISASQKARDVLGWSPIYSDINTIIRHAWLWHVKRFGEKKQQPLPQ